MSPMWNQQTRDHYRIVRCEDCPEWIETVGPNVIRAHTLARRHAKRLIGHTAVIIDLTGLTVEHRYHFDALPMFTDEPPF